MSTSAASSLSPSLSTSTLATSMESVIDFTISYSTVDELFKAIDHASGDCLVVENVSPSKYAEVLRERDERGRKFRFNLYESNTQTLIITIPTKQHELLHRGLEVALWESLMPSGLLRLWAPIGAPTHTLGSQYAPSGGGEGDNTGGPKEFLGPDSWPTLVIESGYSQTLGSLHRKMRWWFSASNHAVQIVVIAKLDRTSSTIFIQRFQEEAAQSRQGATSTRHSSSLQPALMQEIKITRTTVNPAQFTITSGDLNLPFRRLFLRNPTLHEPENVIITVAQLREYAVDFWRVVP